MDRKSNDPNAPRRQTPLPGGPRKAGEKKQNKDGESTKDGVLAFLRIAGKVVFKAFSYILNVLLTVLLVGLICALIIGAVFALYIKNYVDTEIDTSILSTSATDSTTRIYYMDYTDRENRVGTPVEIEDQRIYSSDNSIWVSYSQMPKDLIDAVVCIEDHRFFSHNGVDWITTLKAMSNYFIGYKNTFGASTITQQLIKNLTDEDEVKIERKVKEIFRALSLEKQMSKQEILEMYLNIVYFGNNCYGVQSAANTYFGKDVSELDLAECASLAAIVKNPSLYEPRYHPEENRKRRNDQVMYAMWEEGEITQAEYDAAYDEELTVLQVDENDPAESRSNLFSWYTESVFNSVRDDLMEKYGYSSYVASMSIYTGGLRIYTPMDPEVQSVLEDIYETNSSEVFLATSEALQPESAMVVMDPYTGDVLGLVGGRGKKTQNRILNRATGTKRPPGSSIKPVSVYAPAIEYGILNYGSIVEDNPITLPTGEVWPKNLPHVWEGRISLTRAIATSKNTVAVRVLQELTPQESFNFLKNKLHVTSLVEENVTEDGRVISDINLAPLALGQLSYGISVKELTAAYTIFPNLGIYSMPHLYTRVTDSNGNNILNNDLEQEIVISEQTASIMTKLLMSVTEYQGAGTANKMEFTSKVDTAGKTGTSTADFDRWFVGFTPYYLAGVWVGYDNNIALSSFPSNPASNIWEVVMKRLHEKYITEAEQSGTELRHFSVAPGIREVACCTVTGMPANPYCPETTIFYYTAGEEPGQKCYYHSAPEIEDEAADAEPTPDDDASADAPQTPDEAAAADEAGD